jgi:hypothetical protein
LSIIIRMKTFIILLVLACFAIDTQVSAAKGGYYAKPPAPTPPPPAPVPEPSPSVGEPEPTPIPHYHPRPCPQTEIEICIKIKPVKRRYKRSPMPAPIA